MLVTHPLRHVRILGCLWCMDRMRHVKLSVLWCWCMDVHVLMTWQLGCRYLEVAGTGLSRLIGRNCRLIAKTSRLISVWRRMIGSSGLRNYSFRHFWYFSFQNCSCRKLLDHCCHVGSNIMQVCIHFLHELLLRGNHLSLEFAVRQTRVLGRNSTKLEIPYGRNFIA